MQSKYELRVPIREEIPSFFFSVLPQTKQCTFDRLLFNSI